MERNKNRYRLLAVLLCGLLPAGCAVRGTDEDRPEPAAAEQTEREEPIEQAETEESWQAEEEETGILTSTADIGLHDVDGGDTEYAFTYGEEAFRAVYTPDNWKIVESYRVNNIADMQIICQALIEVHPIHGRDMVSFRTAEDMANEWVQHNLAYAVLADDDPFKLNARDVDLDPKDQNRSAKEIYEDRTGKEFSLLEFLK